MTPPKDLAYFTNPTNVREFLARAHTPVDRPEDRGVLLAILDRVEALERKTGFTPAPIDLSKANIGPGLDDYGRNPMLAPQSAVGALAIKDQEIAWLREGLKRADENQRTQRDALLTLRDDLRAAAGLKPTDDNWSLAEMKLQISDLQSKASCQEDTIEKLRRALIEIASGVGGAVSDQCSDEFLCNVPEEVLAKVKDRNLMHKTLVQFWDLLRGEGEVGFCTPASFLCNSFMVDEIKAKLKKIEEIEVPCTFCFGEDLDPEKKTPHGVECVACHGTNKMITRLSGVVEDWIRLRKAEAERAEEKHPPRKRSDCPQCALYKDGNCTDDTLAWDCNTKGPKPKVDPTEAPEGYVAVPEMFKGGCPGCAFDGGENDCGRRPSLTPCTPRMREDGQAVSFVKKDTK